VSRDEAAPAAMRVLIVDDEPLARTGLRKLVQRDSDLVVVGECSDGREAVSAIERLAPDIVLLDVEMPELDGFGVIDAVPPERMPIVLFFTAYDRYAVRAFERSAVDYVVKPFDDERLTLALERAKRSVRSATLEELSERMVKLLHEVRRSRGSSVAAERDPFLSRLVVKGEGRTMLLDVGEIDWIEAANYYAKLHLGARTHLMRTSLGSLESRLDPSRFFRLHRSAIVNLDRVRELRPSFHGEHVVVLRDGTRLRLPRARRDGLAALLRQPL
jgi:two-component system LytT family response regulator